MGFDVISYIIDHKDEDTQLHVEILSGEDGNDLVRVGGWQIK